MYGPYRIGTVPYITYSFLGFDPLYIKKSEFQLTMSRGRNVNQLSDENNKKTVTKPSVWSESHPPGNELPKQLSNTKP